MEKGSLQQLNKWEEFPAEKTWEQICEACDKRVLQNTLQFTEQIPSSRVWSRMMKKINANSRMRVASLATIFIATLLFFIAQFTNRSAESIPFKNTGLATTQLSTRIESEVLNAVPESTPSNRINSLRIRTKNQSTSISDKKTKSKEHPAYVWVAAKNGEPMRISLRWENLSCCLSGEQETMDCNEQRTQWQTELLTTDLGFQADPLLGLLALLQPNTSS